MNIRYTSLRGGSLLCSSVFVTQSLAAPENQNSGVKTGIESSIPIEGEQRASTEQNTNSEVVQRIVFRDRNNNIITVVTYSNGTYSVSINGEGSLNGAQAMTVLASRGIAITVSSKGEIQGYSLTQNTVVEQDPHVGSSVETGTDEMKTDAADETDGEERSARQDSSAGEETGEQQSASERPRIFSSERFPANIVSGSSYTTNTPTSDYQNWGNAFGGNMSDSNINGRPISQ